MRPTPAEALRAIQGAVAEQLAPEISSLFALEASTAITMLCESLAAEADTIVEDLAADNARIRDVLAAARDILRSLPDGTPQRNGTAAGLVSHIDGVLQEAGDRRLAVSSLSAENHRLSEALAHLLELIEDRADESLASIRRAAYLHLRRVAVRGWTYFDVSAFRQRIVEARAELGRDDPGEAI
jgi:hypothetical protein